MATSTRRSNGSAAHQAFPQTLPSPPRAAGAAAGDPLDSLLATLYQAAVQPELWPEFLQSLAKAVEADAMTLLASSSEGGELREITFDVGTDPKAAEDYQRYFQAIDPWAAAGALELPVGHVAPSESIVSERDLVRTEFYHDYYKRNGWHHGFGAKLLHEEDLVATVTGHRGKRSGPFEDDAMQVLTRLVPHLRRALRMRQEVEGLRLERDAGSELLERVSVGTLLVDERGRVVRANGIAERILSAGDGLTARAEGLEAGTPHETAALRRMIGSAAATSKHLARVHGRDGEADRSAGGPLRLARPSGAAAYLLEVSPLHREAGWGGRGALAVVLVSDGSKGRAPNEAALRSFYGLTPAEAELTALLSHGLSLDEAAERRDVSRNTARGQLKRIFAKTATNRQAELVRMVLQGPAGYARR